MSTIDITEVRSRLQRYAVLASVPEVMGGATERELLTCADLCLASMPMLLDELAELREHAYALAQAEHDIDWGALVKERHPRRSEKPGDVIEVCEQTARAANSIWAGWVTVRRDRWTGPWTEVNE